MKNKENIISINWDQLVIDEWLLNSIAKHRSLYNVSVRESVDSLNYIIRIGTPDRAIEFFIWENEYKAIQSLKNDERKTVIKYYESR